MGITFKDMLKADESLIRDDVPLSFEYIPKILKCRESEQRQFAFAIKPLLQERNGRNLFVYGAPGVGKTVACKHVIKELEEETDTVIPLYINCWKHNSTFKILLEMCNLLNIRLIPNMKTSELFDRIKLLLNKKSAVVVLDEIDKIDDFDVVYMLLEDIYRKSVFLITNYKDKVKELDERIISRLNPDFVEFKPYNKDETRGILAERMQYAFVPGVWDDEAFSLIVDKTSASNDIRQGLFLIREAGNLAEEKVSRKITPDHVKAAITKAEQFSINKLAELDDDLKSILELVKRNQGMKMGDLFQKFLSFGGDTSYKQFTRRIEKLEEGKFVATQKVIGGKDGSTTFVHLYGEKKLTDF